MILKRFKPLGLGRNWQEVRYSARSGLGVLGRVRQDKACLPALSTARNNRGQDPQHPESNNVQAILIAESPQLKIKLPHLTYSAHMDEGKACFTCPSCFGHRALPPLPRRGLIMDVNQPRRHCLGWGLQALSMSLPQSCVVGHY